MLWRGRKLRAGPSLTVCSRAIYNRCMKHLCKFSAALMLAFCCLTACNKSSAPATSSNSAVSSNSKSSDPALEKLQQYAGSGASDCGRLGVGASQDQLKAASDCALHASQGKRPFYVAYDMPGMTVGVAGNSDAKLFTVQSKGAGSEDVTSGDCPSQLRVAASGRVTCLAPGDMGAMGAGHAGAKMPPGTENPHAGGTMPSHKP